MGTATDALEAAENVAVVARGLVKRYGDLVAVDGIDLQVQRGTCLGVLGPNGAGKTTTIEILEGLKQPDAGAVRVLGRCWDDDGGEIRERIGVQLQETEFQDKLTVFELMRMFHSFYRDGADLEDALRTSGLEEKRDAYVKDLSGGQRQRLAVGCALLNKPEILFLDEPTTGLDPQARRRLWEVVERFKGNGGTVVLTTHYMEEADRLCHRVAIMDHGKILALDTPAGLKRSLGAEAVVRVGVEGDLRRLAGQLATLEGARSAQVSEGGVLVYIHGPVARTLPKIFATAEADGYAINDLSVTEPTLETVFLTLTGKDLRE